MLPVADSFEGQQIPINGMTCWANLNHCGTLGFFTRHLQTAFVDGLQSGLRSMLSISSRRVLGSPDRSLSTSSTYMPSFVLVPCIAFIISALPDTLLSS